MNELVIISGKGGTGKTSLTAAFASLADNHVLCDADVDAADLHLLLAPTIKQRHEFIGGGKAVINKDLCSYCGTCQDVCKFVAISENFTVSQIDCEGCGVCVALCPEQAIEFPLQACGEWFVSDTRFGPMIHARLGIGEENSGKLVSLIRKQARDRTEKQGCSLIITDGPPGIGCPVIASISGADAVLIVVEPTLAGLHDMIRVADLAAHFRIPSLICINKYDLNTEVTHVIETEAEKRRLRVVGRIPFDPIFTMAMVQGKTIIEFDPRSPVVSTVESIWQTVRAFKPLNENPVEIIPLDQI